jgi:hypothetical protein
MDVLSCGISSKNIIKSHADIGDKEHPLFTPPYSKWSVPAYIIKPYSSERDREYKQYRI